MVGAHLSIGNLVQAIESTLAIATQRGGTVFRDDGIQNIKTAAGTAYTLPKVSVSTANREELLAWVQEQGAWEFLDIKPNKTTVKAFRDEHDDLPPGVNWYEELTVGIRRS